MSDLPTCDCYETYPGPGTHREDCEVRRAIERLTAALKHAEEMSRCWKANAEALADVANKAEANADRTASVLLECAMNHSEAHYIAQAELDRMEALKGDNDE